jgi:putative ABC transport system permease protein
VSTAADRGGTSLSFASLVLINVTTKKLRLALTALAIAIGVVTVVSLGVLTHSLETSDLTIMQMGRADFTISQKGVSDVLSSSINQSTLEQIAAYPHVAKATGVLLSMVKYNADNPLFLEIGLQPSDLDAFGVTVVAGQPYSATATNQIMLGWRAAANLHVGVGSPLHLDGLDFRVVGLFSTGQAQGDSGAMFPLAELQTMKRQSQQVTLVFVRATPGTNVAALQSKIDQENPQLVTVRTVAQFGRADRSLALIRAADRGSAVLAVIIGAVVVMSALSMTLVERFREFGVLAAIGWARLRVLAMIMCEALAMGLLGAAMGSGLSVLAVWAINHLPALRGVLHPEFTAGNFASALVTAAAMSVLGGLYPAFRASRTAPLEALRHE